MTAAQQQAVNQAEAQARTSGKPVAVDALTTETWQVSALPGGGLSLADNPLPVRTLRNGTWIPVDTTLARNTDGTYSPAATAYATVTLSGGGNTALASTVTASGATYQLSWPTTLPVPTISGSSATYANVLAGVDLQISANANGGFGESLIVHSAAAAVNPALAELTLGVRTTGTHSAAGALAETADGTTLTLSGAMMWDSNTTPDPASVKSAGSAKAVGAGSAATPTLAQVAASAPSTATSPGYAAHQAPVGVSASPTALTLTPNKTLLTGKDTVYPVVIDPTMVWHTPSMSAPAFDEVKQDSPCNSQSFYNDYSEDGNGSNLAELGAGWTNTYCGGIQRAYFQWALPSVLQGAHVNLAQVNATEDWQASFSCTESRTVNLHLAGGIGSGTDYNNQPGYITGTNAYSTSTSVGAAYNPSGCKSPATSAAGFTVTTPIQWSATNNASQVTFALAQDGSTNYAAFDRFAQNPTLNIQYDHNPTTPTAGQLSAASGASDVAACATSTPYPYIGKSIASNTTTLTAGKISSQDGDQLQATFKYWLTSTPGTTYTGLSADNIASGNNATYSLPPTFTNALTTGQNVSWQVQTNNGTYQSNWSPTCTFTAEPTAPDAPSVAANATYPPGTAGAAAGTTATFQVAGNASGAAAVKFYYGLDQVPATSGTPASEIANATNNAAALTITPLSAGQHTLYVDSVDAAGDVSSTYSYVLIAKAHAPTNCASLAACYNNTAITPTTNTAAGNADGAGYSINAADLTTAGWNTGGNVTIDGANLTLPTYSTATTAHADNVLAAGQTVTYPYTAPTTGASSLVFLATATNANTSLAPGEINGSDTAPLVPMGTGVAGTYAFSGTLTTALQAPEGVINYATGGPTPADYYLPVPDWDSGPSTLAAITLPDRNLAGGAQDTTNHPKIYAFSVPLAPGATVSSIVLPDVASGPAGTQALHIFSIGTRNTTKGTVETTGTSASTTLATPTGQTWTGAWAGDTEGNYNFESGNFNNQSFRILLQPTVSGGTIRIKLDNALGTSPLDIGHATVALTSGNAIAPTPVTSAPANLKFDGAASTVVPEGGMIYSDPLAFNVTAGQWLAVSFDLTNSIPYLVQHSWATDSYEYVAPINSADQTGDPTGAKFTASGSTKGTFTDLVTGLDVQTAGIPTQIVFGDNLIDAWQPNTAPLSPNNGNALRLSDDLAAASPTTPIPYGTINAGIESNQLMKDNPQILNGTATGEAVGGPAALSRIDRDVLDEPGVDTVIIDQGLEDALAGTNFTTIQTGYNSLLTYLGAANPNTPINTIAVGLTPCDTYNGDGAATGNDPCTASVDNVRTSINGWLAGVPPYLDNYIDPDATIGVSDTGNGEIKLGPLAMVALSRNNSPSDPVNLTNAGTGALANAILAAQDQWQLNDGTGQTSAADASPGTNNAYLTATDPANSGNNPLTLNGTYTWPTATVGSQANTTVLGLDGTTAYGATSGPVLNTSASYTVSAWADLSALPTHNSAIAAQDGTNDSGFYLAYQYHSGSPVWAFYSTTSDIASPSWNPTVSTSATTGWTHVVGVYNAAAKTAQLYVNGTLAATATWATTWNANGPFTVGRDLSNGANSDFFPGQISDVQAWNYALSAPQIVALHDQIQ